MPLLPDGDRHLKNAHGLSTDSSLDFPPQIADLGAKTCQGDLPKMLAQIGQDDTRARVCFLLMLDLDASAHRLSHGKGG